MSLQMGICPASRYINHGSNVYENNSPKNSFLYSHPHMMTNHLWKFAANPAYSLRETRLKILNSTLTASPGIQTDLIFNTERWMNDNCIQLYIVT